jgi:hypothetical protein
MDEIIKKKAELFDIELAMKRLSQELRRLSNLFNEGAKQLDQLIRAEKAAQTPPRKRKV